MANNNSNDVEERARTQTESKAAAAGHQIGLQAQSKQVNQQKYNPQFYDKFTKSSLEESKAWSHLPVQNATWLADDHVLANRRQIFRKESQLLDRVRAEESIVNRSPSRLLKSKPLIHALFQDLHPELDEMVPLDGAGQKSLNLHEDEEFKRPVSADDRLAIHDLARIATARHSMGVDSAGAESLTKATTESRTVREDETEQTGTLGSISGVFD